MNIPENYSPRARRVVESANSVCREFGGRSVNCEHLLLALLRLEEGVACNAIAHMGVQIRGLQEKIVELLKKSAGGSAGSEDEASEALRKVMNVAKKEAKSMNHAYVGTEHLLLAILLCAEVSEKSKELSAILDGAGLSYGKVSEQIKRELHADGRGNDGDESAPKKDSSGDIWEEMDKRLRKMLDSTRRDRESSEKNDGNGDGDDERPRGNDEDDDDEPPFPPRSRGDRLRGRRSAVKKFCRDLTEEARQGKFDPVIGREAEQRRMIEVLCRRRKSNPVLIGEAGVGKTAVVEALAQAIAENRVPEILKNKRIVSLSINDILAGTQFRGQFEERVKLLIDEITEAKNIILFIDEIHTIVGAGKSEGSPGDAADIMKPALSRGEFQCIGATTQREYRRYIEKDAALERRFQSIKIDEPNEKEALEILHGVSGKYESFHHCRYTPEALEAAVYYSVRYIPARSLPDKAIDIIDQAGARARLEGYNPPAKIRDLEAKVKLYENKREEAARREDLEAARNAKERRDAAKEALEIVVSNWRERSDGNISDVDEDCILKVVSEIAKVPVARMDRNEAERLLSLEENLRKTVIAQDEACSAVSRALRRSRANLRDPKRPIGSFLFLGPTGVGKTLLAKTVAEQMFGTADALIQINMSEYMEKYEVSRMIGSAPGYVGYEEGGKLTEAVRKNPYSVVLFDEIEKAHPDAIQLLLQILEEGSLTDGTGVTADFRNTIVIMTSNVGADALQRNSRMGFRLGGNDDLEGMKNALSSEVKRAFRPEFLNRLTDCIFFRRLNKTDLSEIVKIEVEKLSKRLERLKTSLTLTPAAYAFLVEKGSDEKYGARPLRRAVERYLEDPLSEEILRNTDKALQNPIAVDAGKDALVFYAAYKKTAAAGKSVSVKTKTA